MPRTERSARNGRAPKDGHQPRQIRQDTECPVVALGWMFALRNSDVRAKGSPADVPDNRPLSGAFASWIGQAGDPAPARDLFAALLPVRERVFGPAHLDSQAVQDELAIWTGKADSGHSTA
jgi:hypothetical protein